MLQYVLIAASVLAAAVPMFGFLAAVWWLDRYDREPVWLVLLTFLWGAVGATSLSLVGNTSISLGLQAMIGSVIADQVTAVVVAPLIEEPTKAAVLFLLLLSRHFDNTTDGFVYGAAVGLGFGMTENFMYFSTAAGAAGFDPVAGLTSWTVTVAARTFYSAVMHATATSCVGAAIGLSRYWSLPLRGLGILGGFAVAVGMHATWNGLLTVGQSMGPEWAMLDFALFPVEFAVVFAIFQVCLWRERRVIARELQAEAREGTLPPEHVRILASYLERSWSHFVDGRVDQDAYVRAATALAFRRIQARRSRGPRAEFLARDVERLRREVRGILGRLRPETEG